MDSSNFTRPPRVFRYVEPGTLPGKNLLAVLDPVNNLLIINRELFALLDEVDRREVLRTEKTSLTYDPGASRP